MPFTILSQSPSVIEVEHFELDDDGNVISHEMIVKDAVEVLFEYTRKDGGKEIQKYRFDNDMIVDGDVTPNVASVVEQITQ